MHAICLNLNNRTHVGRNGLEKIDWLLVNDHFEQIISSCDLNFATTGVHGCI